MKRGPTGGGGSGEYTKNLKIFVYQPILMKFGTRWFFGLVKPNPCSICRNSEKGAPQEGGGGESQKSQKICLWTDFDKIWY